MLFPKKLRNFKTTEKLIWTWIYLNGQNEYTMRSLRKELGISTGAFHYLIEGGLLRELVPPMGTKAGVYEAIHPEKEAAHREIEQILNSQVSNEEKVHQILEINKKERVNSE